MKRRNRPIGTYNQRRKILRLGTIGVKFYKLRRKDYKSYRRYLYKLKRFPKVSSFFRLNDKYLCYLQPKSRNFYNFFPGKIPENIISSAHPKRRLWWARLEQRQTRILSDNSFLSFWGYRKSLIYSSFCYIKLMINELKSRINFYLFPLKQEQIKYKYTQTKRYAKLNLLSPSNRKLKKVNPELQTPSNIIRDVFLNYFQRHEYFRTPPGVPFQIFNSLNPHPSYTYAWVNKEERIIWRIWASDIVDVLYDKRRWRHRIPYYFGKLKKPKFKRKHLWKFGIKGDRWVQHSGYGAGLKRSTRNRIFSLFFKIKWRSVFHYPSTLWPFTRNERVKRNAKFPLRIETDQSNIKSQVAAYSWVATLGNHYHYTFQQNGNVRKLEGLHLLKKLPKPFIRFPYGEKPIRRQNMYLLNQYIRKSRYHKFRLKALSSKNLLEYVNGYNGSKLSNDFLSLILSQSIPPIHVLIKILLTSWKELICLIILFSLSLLIRTPRQLLDRRWFEAMKFIEFLRWKKEKKDSLKINEKLIKYERKRKPKRKFIKFIKSRKKRKQKKKGTRKKN